MSAEQEDELVSALLLAPAVSGELALYHHLLLIDTVNSTWINNLDHLTLNPIHLLFYFFIFTQ